MSSEDYLDKDLRLQPSTVDTRYYELIEVIEVSGILTVYHFKPQIIFITI